MNEILQTGLTAAGFTLLLLLIFVVSYWALRGFMPGSRLVEMPLVSPNDLDDNTVRFKLFHVTWCPYSREAVTSFKSFKGFIEEKGYTYGNKSVEIELIDCEDKKNECSLYSVDAYPTYKLETNNKMIEYKGPPNITAYREFLVKAVGKERGA